MSRGILTGKPSAPTELSGRTGDSNAWQDVDYYNGPHAQPHIAVNAARE